MFSDLELFLRLVAATFLAGVLGWERETLGKSAGLRTHILVGTGAALAVIAGDRLVEIYATHEPDLLRVDPLRMLEAVLTGIGFLGAGTIIFRPKEERIAGLTTAASIWATAAIGVAAGAGEYELAAAATALIFVVLRGLGFFERRYLRRTTTND